MLALTAPLIDTLSTRPDIWFAGTLAPPAQTQRVTGFQALDAVLPDGGWPQGAIIELLQAPAQTLEWGLLLPALVAAQQEQPGPVVLINPPHMPLAPSLNSRGLAAERLLRLTANPGQASLWAARQALQCSEVVAVLAWLPQARAADLRRLQTVAKEHDQLLFVFRPQSCEVESSPAPLRLLLRPSPEIRGGLQLNLLKRRGPPLTSALHLSVQAPRLLALLSASHDQARHRRNVAPAPTTLSAKPPSTGNIYALDRPARSPVHPTRQPA